MANLVIVQELFYLRFALLRADLHPATRSARRGPRACGARKISFLRFYGTAEAVP